MWKKALIVAAAGALLAAPIALAQDSARPTPCHPGCEVRVITSEAWIPAQYRTTSVREFVPARFERVPVETWIPARYHTVSDREWVPIRYTTRLVKVWVPPRYTTERQRVRNSCGQTVGYRRVRRALSGTGQYVLRHQRTQVPGTGQHVVRQRTELVPGTGQTVVTHTQRQVPGTGEWTRRTDRSKVPGTGEFRKVARHEVIHREPEPLPVRPLRATGTGAAPPIEGLQRAQARLLALRAARLDALRKLSEQLSGVRIDSRTTVLDLIARSDEISAAVQGFIRGARETSGVIHEDGTAEVVLQIDAAALQTFLASEALQR